MRHRRKSRKWRQAQSATPMYSFLLLRTLHLSGIWVKPIETTDDCCGCRTDAEYVTNICPEVSASLRTLPAIARRQCVDGPINQFICRVRLLLVQRILTFHRSPPSAPIVPCILAPALRPLQTCRHPVGRTREESLAPCSQVETPCSLCEEHA